MKAVQLLLIGFFTCIANQLLYAQYVGGSNDGFSISANCAVDLNGNSLFILNPISGSSTFCSFGTEGYSIVVGGATPTTTYTWSVPAGATITSGQGTNTILVTFGNSSGIVSVDVGNECGLSNVTLPVSLTSCSFYNGGTNDGFSTAGNCATNLTGGSAFSIGPIAGSTTFCSFGTEGYSIVIGGATSTTTYAWSVPAGATITSGQGTNTILVTFSNSSGIVSVDVGNDCGLSNVTLPVSLTSCSFYNGGTNDGFSIAGNCATNLTGGSAFSIGPIAGSTTFCSFATDAYSIAVGGATPTTTYVWSVPAGATITSGQGTNTILITFSNSSGIVSVDVANECESSNITLPVSLTSCVFYAGGPNDGFSVTTVNNIALPVELISFTGKEESGVVELMWITASELNNDFFMVEKSHNGREFNSLVKVTGSGTTNDQHTYTTVDNYPYYGISYYRLLQQDLDGTITYSNVIVVKVESTQKTIRIFPNPVINRNELYLECYNQIDETAIMTYVDSRGIAQRSESLELVTGYNRLTLSPQFTSSGIYIALIKTHTGVKVIRIAVP